MDDRGEDQLRQRSAAIDGQQTAQPNSTLQSDVGCTCRFASVGASASAASSTISTALLMSLAALYWEQCLGLFSCSRCQCARRHDVAVSMQHISRFGAARVRLTSTWLHLKAVYCMQAIPTAKYVVGQGEANVDDDHSMLGLPSANRLHLCPDMLGSSLQALSSRWRTHSIWTGAHTACLPLSSGCSSHQREPLHCARWKGCIKTSMCGCSVPGAWESMVGPARGQGAAAHGQPAPGAALNGVPVPQQPQPGAVQMV